MASDGLTRLRGRDPEVATLQERVRAAAAGLSPVVLLEGPAGMGRSRLLGEAARMASGAGLTVVSGAGREVAAVAPLETLLEALRASGVLAAADLESLGESPGRILDRLVTRLCEQTRRRPLLVAIDDVQWADAASLLAVGTLAAAREAQGVLWILSRRHLAAPPELELAFARLAAGGGVRLALAPLAGGQAVELASDVLGAAPDAPLETLIEAAAGRPAYVVELLRGLLDEGRVDMVDGTATARGTALPARLDAVVTGHLRSLSPAARHLLDAGSVLGPTFTAAQAAVVLGRSADQVRPAVREALAARVLTSRVRRLAFAQGLVRRVVHDRLPVSLAQALHGDAGRLRAARERSPVRFDPATGPGEEEWNAVLRQAARAPRTSWAAAGDGAGRWVLELMPRNGERSRLLAGAVLLFGSMGRAAEAEELAMLALDHDLDQESEVGVRLGVAIALIRGGRRDEAVHHVRRGLEVAPAGGRLRAGILAAHAATLVRSEPARAARVAGAAIRVGEAAGDLTGVAGGQLVRATVAVLGGRLDRALALAADAAQRTGPGSATPDHPRHLVALTLMALSRFEEALSVASEGRREGEETGSRWCVGICETVAAMAHLGAGRLDEARSGATTALGVARDPGLDLVGAEALAVLEEVAVRQGDLARARWCADRLSSLPADRRSLGAHPAWTSAMLAAADGDPASALHALADAVSELRQGRLLFGAVDVSRLPRAVGIALAAGDPAQATVVATAARRLALQNRRQPAIAGSAAHAEGLLEGDASLLTEAVELLRGAGRPLALAGALEDLGLALVAEGSRARAREAVEEAHETFMARGAGRDAARLRRLLRRLGVPRRLASTPVRSVAGWGSLTESELRTVHLVAEGLTNQAVAERMFVSTHTVNTHLRHAFSKLRVRSRVDLTRLVLTRREEETP